MESITIEVAPDAAAAFRNAGEEQRRRITAVVESQLRQTATASMVKLPDWCNVYEGLTDEEIDDIESAIVRDPGTRRFG